MRAAQVIAVVSSALFLSGGPILAQEKVPELVVVGSTLPQPIVFGRDDLEQLGLVEMRTRTPWNDGVVTFEGVPMALLLEAAGVNGAVATVTALNDYSVDIPTADFSEHGVILAIKRNGEYMPTSDQGPFFVMYPFDSNPALQVQPYHSRAVWQVKEISVE